MSHVVSFRFWRINIISNIFRTFYIVLEENYIAIIIVIELSPSPRDIMPNQTFKPSVSIRHHKSTTDLPYSPQHGYMLGQRSSICTPTEAELAQMRRCSLHEPNVRPCCRHALSFPNMTSPCPSPLCSTPSRSALCTPVRDVECSVKARNKLIEK